MQRLGLGISAIAMTAALTAPALAQETVQIVGSQDNVNSWFGIYDTSVLFQPRDGDITVSGTVDISGFDTASTSDNSVLFIGLIDKDAFDAEVGSPGDSFFGFLKTNYGSYNFSDNAQFRGRLGENVGDISQKATSSLPDGVIDDVDIIFKQWVTGSETYELTAEVAPSGTETIS